jgi:phosphoribosylformylglycinamidine synthase PurS subunit
MFLAKIYVTLKPAVNDPPGQTVLAALRRMGYESASDVRVGKFLQLKVEGMERLQAERQVDEMCQKLLANPVIEDYRFELEEIAP